MFWLASYRFGAPLACLILSGFDYAEGAVMQATATTRQSTDSLFDSEGRRLYLTDDERIHLVRMARDTLAPKQALYVEMLAFSGCRVSEALNLTAQSVNLGSGEVVFNTLKKRRDDHYRIVPLPADFLERLAGILDLRKLQSTAKGRATKLWPMSRQRVAQFSLELFRTSGLDGHSPKSLRHAWAVTALNRGVDLVTVSKCLGHSSLETTALYLDAMGDERKSLVLKMWDR